ncbi:MAG TPA: DUF6600 domain-containing protein [Chthoniobacterales bacterium]|nr:DUF6600 domain-containing protein [Chthoniobacterales bacterium]
MKRILLAVTILALVLPAMRQAEARVDVSIDFFYDNMGSDGSWVELADYGYCWQPNVVVSNAKWRPYSDGYWVYTDVGWTWVSYEDFGWATYHYGRWVRLRDRGWFWVPGREWGPAWVSWRTGGDHVGWAPLPPRGRGDVEYDNRSITGHVDVEFDIGPSYYNFVDVRYIGEPVLRERIVESSLNITFISSTVNVTNITYTNSRVHNYGPDYDTVSRYSTRPIRRMTLEHDANADLSGAVRSRGITRVEGDRLIVAAPLTFQKPAKPVAPKVVKEKIAKPTFERGWDGVADPKAQAELKEKMKKEDPKTIPPPSIKPRDGAETAQSPGSASPAPAAPGSTPASGTSPAVSGSPAAIATPAAAVSPTMPSDQDKGKGKDKDEDKPARDISASPNPAAVTSPAISPSDKPKRERGDKPAPALSPSASIAPKSSPAPRITAPPLPASTPPKSEPPGRDPEARKDKRTEKAPDVTPQTRQPPDAQTEKPPRKPKDESIPAPPPREVQRDSPPKRNPPPEEPVPVKRETPPPTSQKQPPAERMAPPPGPATSKPEKADQAPGKRPDKKAAEPAPSPGS